MAAPERRNASLWDFVSLVAGAGAGPALALLVSPVLTRLFTPEDVGKFAVFVALLGVDVVICLGYERAALLPRDLQSRFDVLMVAIGASCGWALIVAIALILFGPQIAGWVSAGSLGGTAYVLPVALLASGCMQALTGWHLASRTLGRISLGRFAQATTAAGGQIAWGFAGGGAIGLAIAHCLGLVMAVVTLAGRVLHAFRSAEVRWHGAGVVAAMRRYRYFTLSSGAALMNAATLQLPLLVLSARFGIATAGWIGLAQRVAGGTVTLLVTASSQVFSSRIIEPIRAGNRHEVARIYRKIVLLHASVALLGLATLPFAPAIFAFMFGDQWRESGVIVQMLGVGLAAQFSFSPVYGVLNLVERQGVHMAVEAVRLTMLSVALLTSVHAGATLHATLLSVAVALALGYILAGSAAFLAIRRMKI